MCRPEKGPGMFVWFDPEREELQLFAEPPKDSGVEDFSEEDALDIFAYGPEVSKQQFLNEELPLGDVGG